MQDERLIGSESHRGFRSAAWLDALIEIYFDGWKYHGMSGRAPARSSPLFVTFRTWWLCPDITYPRILPVFRSIFMCQPSDSLDSLLNCVPIHKFPSRK